MTYIIISCQPSFQFDDKPTEDHHRTSLQVFEQSLRKQTVRLLITMLQIKLPTLGPQAIAAYPKAPNHVLKSFGPLVLSLSKSSDTTQKMQPQ